MIADIDANVDVTLKDVVANVKDVVAQDAKIDETKSKDKGKGILVEEPKPLKKQAQIEKDEAYTRELEAKLNKNIDWDEVIDHVQRKQKEDNAVKRYQALKRKPQTKAQARKNMMIYQRNVVGFKTDYFKGMSYDDIPPIFEKKFNSNMAFLLKTKEQMDEEDSRALKRLSESQDDKTAKKQKLDEEVPVVDYEIYTMNNKPYYKIKRADGSHQLYLSFLSGYTSSNLEKSKKCLWSSKGQELEAARVLWCADYHIHYNTIDFAGREEISTYKGRSCLHEGTSIYPWLSITCRNGSKRKRSPPTTFELFTNSLKSLFARFGTPRAIIRDRVYDQACENSLIYKEKTKRLHDSKIKDRVFKVGDRVLLFNSRLKIFSGKLKTCWSRPFTITQVFLYGTTKLSQTDRPNFKVNGHRLKHYFGEDIPKMVVPDLQNFPMDQ
nr:reverse transcriptase domain-containing protein [Tanacetum cinerariifolium]